MADIKVYGTLRTMATDGIVATADQLRDTNVGKFQEEINQELAGGMEGKQDTIEDLEQIRSLANSAVQPSVLQAAIADFITKSVDDLVNYYKKSETYTKTEVNGLIGSIKQFTYRVASSLPTASESTMYIIYLIPSSNASTQNVKDEFITIQNGSSYSWEQIGSTKIDLSGYSTTEEMNAAILSGLNNLSFLTGEKVVNLGVDEEPTANSNNLVKSGGVYEELALGTVYDVSAKNPTAGSNNDGKFESLSALLSDANLNTLIPIAIRKGGMSIKFVQSSDNKYVQYRLMHPLDNPSTAAADFANTANWQGVDSEPTAGSDNLVKSGGVLIAIGSGDELADKVQLRVGRIQGTGKIIHVVTERYGCVFLKAGYTISSVFDPQSGAIYNFGKSEHDVSIGDTVELINGNKYTAEEDCYIAFNAGCSLISLLITPPEATLDSFTDSEPTKESDRLVRSDGVHGKINDVFSGGLHTNEFDDIRMSVIGSYYESATGFVSDRTRIRLLKKVEKGVFIDISTSNSSSYPIAASIYANKSGAISNALDAYKSMSKPNGYLQLIDNSWKLTAVSVASMYDGWLVVSIKKSDGSNFTEAEYNAAISSVTVKCFYHSITNNPQGFVTVFTTGSFNVDNSLKKLAYPTFYYIDNLRYYTINSGEIDLSTLAQPSKTFALAIDQVSNNLIVTDLNTGKRFSRIIAVLVREGTNVTNDYISFYGCYREGLWLIDGKDGFALINDKLKSIGFYNGTDTVLQNAEIYRKLPSSSTAEDDPNGTRLRIIYPISIGTYIKASTTFDSSGIFVGCYSTKADAIYMGTNGQNISPTYDFSNFSAEGVSTRDGYLVISFTNGNYAISNELKAEMLESLEIDLADGELEDLFKDFDARFVELENETQEIESTTEELQDTVENLQEVVSVAKVVKNVFIGSLVQKGYTASGLSDNANSKRVSMQSVIAVPYMGVELSVKAPEGYYFGIRIGDKAENLSTHKYWIGDGDKVTIDDNCRYYRICFGKGTLDTQTMILTDVDVSVSEIEGLISSGEFKITYTDDHNIIKNNKETEKYVKAIMREFYSNASLNNTLPNIPVFAHMSDIHGDAKRFDQFLDYCDYIGVHAALITGDFAAVNPNNSSQWINDVADKHSTIVLPCTGNHDVRGLYTAKEQNEQVVGYLMSENNVTVNPSEGDYNTYYYKDFASQKIRVIALNVHELTRNYPDGCNITQTQAEWLISVLANTPADYGVLVMFHEPEVITDKDSSHDTFYQPFYTIAIYQTDGISGAPISKIIDAFISKTSANITYTSQGTSITVSADFTNVATGVEFIAYICGHEHIDWIGTVHGTTNRQLMLDVTCGIALYGNTYPYLANISDIARGGNGVTQDAFNIYGIDRVNKTVRVARVGSNITSEAKDRKCMIIPYV